MNEINRASMDSFREKHSRWQIFKILWREFWECANDIYFLERSQYGLKPTATPVKTVIKTQYLHIVNRQWTWVDSVKGIPAVKFWSGALVVILLNLWQRKKKRYQYCLVPVADGLFMADVFGEEAPATKEDMR